MDMEILTKKLDNYSKVVDNFDQCGSFRPNDKVLEVANKLLFSWRDVYITLPSNLDVDVDFQLLVEDGGLRMTIYEKINDKTSITRKIEVDIVNSKSEFQLQMFIKEKIGEIRFETSNEVEEWIVRIKNIITDIPFDNIKELVSKIKSHLVDYKLCKHCGTPC